MGKERKPFPPWQSSRKDDGFNMLSNTLTHSEAFRCLSGKLFVHATAKGGNDSTENIPKYRSGMQR